MRWRTTIILIILALALGLFVYFTELHPGPSNTSTESITVLRDVHVDDVTEFRLQKDQQALEAYLSADGGWMLRYPVQSPADSDRIRQALGFLVYAHASRVLSPREITSLADYGLLTPALEWRLHLHNGRRLLILVGDQTPQRMYYYLKKGDDESIYIVATNLVEVWQRLLDEPPYPHTPTPDET
ncbi:MAG: DUF4340 domain-containing protein, partial [Anaerolineae bacterium]